MVGLAACRRLACQKRFKQPEKRTKYLPYVQKGRQTARVPNTPLSPTAMVGQSAACLPPTMKQLGEGIQVLKRPKCPLHRWSLGSIPCLLGWFCPCFPPRPPLPCPWAAVSRCSALSCCACAWAKGGRYDNNLPAQKLVWRRAHLVFAVSLDG